MATIESSCCRHIGGSIGFDRPTIEQILNTKTPAREAFIYPFPESVSMPRNSSGQVKQMIFNTEGTARLTAATKYLRCPKGNNQDSDAEGVAVSIHDAKLRPLQ